MGQDLVASILGSSMVLDVTLKCSKQVRGYLALSLTFRVNRMHHLGLKMKASRSFVDARQRTQSNLQKQVGE